MNASPDAEIIDGKFPLIIISHGNGGTEQSAHIWQKWLHHCNA